jgi:hypothetical protein
MSGYNLVRRIHSLEEQCRELGLMMCHSQSDYMNQFGDVVAVKPMDQDSLPVYSRDAELFVGTLDGLENWIKGIEWARRYDTMLFGAGHNDRRVKKEQSHRNHQLIKTIKGSSEKV